MHEAKLDGVGGRGQPNPLDLAKTLEEAPEGGLRGGLRPAGGQAAHVHGPRLVALAVAPHAAPAHAAAPSPHPAWALGL